MIDDIDLILALHEARVESERVEIINGRHRRLRVEVFALGPHGTILADMKDSEKCPVLPGGAIDGDETPEEAGMREMAEESGWTARNARVMPVPEDSVFSGPEDSWFTRDGWHEESTTIVLAQAVAFRPTSLYGSEGDSGAYKLVPINSVIEQTRSAIHTGMASRKKFHAEFRIKALNALARYNG